MVGLDEMRTALRFTTHALDEEIQRTMRTAQLRLIAAGFKECNLTYEMDGLRDVAVEMYLKWHFNFRGKGAEYERIFEDLSKGIALETAEPTEDPV